MPKPMRPIPTSAFQKYFTCHGPNTKDCPQESKLKNVKKHAEITDMGPLV